jgi:ATP-dependent helicase/nuclease subunit A
MPLWTSEQQTAIDARNCNLLVSAAAGSGKTAVLTERILQLILRDRVELDSLLVVTFTNAAAGEMRERIGTALTKAMDGSNEEDNEHLRSQLNLLAKASISTLHSFCISVIRKYFHVIDLDPGFRIGDETECSLIKLEVVEDLFEKEYEKGSEAFLGLVERFSSNRQDTGLQDLVLGLHNFIQSKPYPLQWLEERIQDFAADAAGMEKSPWGRALLDAVRLDIQGIVSLLEEALSLCRKPYGPAPYEENLLDDIRQMNDILLAAGKGLQACRNAYGRVKFSRLKGCGKDVDEDLKEQVRKLREQAKKALKNTADGILDQDLTQSIEQLNELYPYIQYLGELVFKFDSEFKKQKQEKGILDFNDLEHYTLKILEHSRAADELKQKYSHIFIDEYQDSNLVQDTIISRISSGNNVFMVGDVKQSIYRFRLADPSIFLEKYGSYRAGEGETDRRIDLNRNFRSRKSILDSVNYIFRNIMSPQLGELEYDDKAALYPGRALHPESEPEVELHLIEKNTDDDEELDPELENLNETEVEAAILAEQIKEIVGREIYDARLDAYRKAEYRDIVLLLRTTKNRASVYQEVFSARGIPVYADVNTGYFEALEVKTITALLNVIDNKCQDIPLLTVMRSPIGGFDADDLIRIRTADNSRFFYRAAMEYAEKHEDELAGRLKAFYEKIEEWQNASRYLPMEDFIWKLYMESGYYYYAGAMPGGQQRQANLRILLERARQFQQTSVKGLFQFIRFIEKLQGGTGDMGVAKTLGENENVLRIMSIHKSKGLEFPVVILAGLGRRFNFSDTKAPVLFHKDLGLGPKYVNPDTRQTCQTLARTAMKHIIRTENLSEEMRILYVAMTRAKERLILLGSAGDLKKTAGNWAKPVSSYSLSKALCFLDWIGPVLMRHPDGDVLRSLLDEPFDQPLIADESKWKLQLHSRGDIAEFRREEAVSRSEFLHRLKHPEEYIPRLEAERQQSDGEADGRQQPESDEAGRLKGLGADHIRAMINERFTWEYPHRHAVNIPSKLTVTEISKLHGLRAAQLLEEAEESLPSFATAASSRLARPGFLEGSRQFTAAEIGSIVHFILQHLDLDRAGDKDEVLVQLNEMVQRELLTEEEVRAADLNMITDFLNSEIGRRIRRAGGLRREVPFNLRKKAGQLFPDMPPVNDTLLVQGVIDCFFEEDGQWVLVDYKTDYVDSPQKVKELAERYRIQMNLYAEALEQITGKPVKERILCLLHANQAVSM